MDILWTILIGFVAGAVGKLLMPGKDPGGWIITTLLGIGGAVVMNVLGKAVGWYGEGEGAGFIASVLGAVLLLALYRIFRKKRSA